MTLEGVLNSICVISNLKAKNKVEAIKEIVSHLEREKLIKSKEEALKVIMERENLGTTGIGDRVAIPHGKLEGLESIVCALGISEDGIDFEALDGKPVNLIFLILIPKENLSLHLEVLSRISRLIRNQSVVRSIIEKKDEKSVVELLREWESQFEAERR